MPHRIDRIKACRSTILEIAGTVAAAIFLFAATCTPALTADYVAEPIASAVQLNAPPKVADSGLALQGLVTQQASYDSNPLLEINGTKALYGSTTAPELVIKDSTPDAQITADTTVDDNVFNQSTFNSVDFHSAAGIQGGNERWTAGVTENTDYDTTRTSEISNFNLTTRPFRHTGFQLAPQASFSPTAIDKISLVGDFTTSNYDSTVFSDYQILGLTPTYVHNVDPNNAAVFAVQAQHYETTSNSKSQTDSIGPSIGWITALTPDLMAKVTGGFLSSRQTGTGVPSQSTLSPVFSADITYTGLTDTVSLVASRQEYPLGDGAEDLLTAMQLQDAHKLNDNLMLNLGAGYQSSTYQTAFNGSLGKQYSASVGLTYAVSNRVDVTGSYQYRYETLAGLAGTAQDHLFTLGLVYRLDTRSF